MASCLSVALDCKRIRRSSSVIIKTPFWIPIPVHGMEGKNAPQVALALDICSNFCYTEHIVHLTTQSRLEVPWQRATGKNTTVRVDVPAPLLCHETCYLPPGRDAVWGTVCHVP